LRLMKLAEKFKRPVVTLIEPPGAYPGIGAEERARRKRSRGICARWRCSRLRSWRS
jgi:acetyl-CoA carboxylase alpha subunit